MNSTDYEEAIVKMEDPEDREFAENLQKANTGIRGGGIGPGSRGPYLKEITPKQRKLIKYYIQYPDDPMKACQKAGYNPASIISARAIIHKTKKKAELTMQKELSNAQLSADWIVRKLVDLTNTAKKDSDKIRSLELLGKYLKIFTDKVEVSGGVSNSYEFKVKDMSDDQLERIIAGEIPTQLDAVVLDALPEGDDSSSEDGEVAA